MSIPGTLELYRNLYHFRETLVSMITSVLRLSCFSNFSFLSSVYSILPFSKGRKGR